VTCTAVTVDTYYTYKQYYAGTGVTENYNNPGNIIPASFPPLINYIDGSTDACDAISQCASLTYDNGLHYYYSFDLHFTISNHTWECVQFFDGNNDPSYFNQADPDVSVAYGYTH